MGGRLFPPGSRAARLRSVAPMSKKTAKRKIKARRKKANHGKKPNAGKG
jgi:hypothetical protein